MNYSGTLDGNNISFDPWSQLLMNFKTKNSFSSKNLSAIAYAALYAQTPIQKYEYFNSYYLH